MTASSAHRELVPSIPPAPHPLSLCVTFTLPCPFSDARSKTPTPGTFPLPRCKPGDLMPPRTPQREAKGPVVPPQLVSADEHHSCSWAGNPRWDHGWDLGKGAGP